MPSGLKFDPPSPGSGAEGTAGPDEGAVVEYRHVMQLIGDLNGIGVWSRQKNFTGFTHDTEYLMQLFNNGSGGKHLDIQGAFNVETAATTAENALVGQSTLDITGATTLNDILHTVGAGTFDSTLDVTGAGTFGATVDVTGDGTFGANVDITGNLTVGGTFELTGLGTFAAGLTLSGGVLTLPAGSAAAPSLAIGGATDGLYRAAAGQVNVALAGVHGATFKGAVQTSTAGLGINTLAPQRPIHAVGSSGAVAALPTLGAVDVLVLENNGNANIALVAATTGQSRLRFYDTIEAGSVTYDHTTDELQLVAGATVNLRVTATGFGVFNTAPAAQQTGGSSTAGAAYGGTEQTMLQAAYDCLRTFGFLS